MSKRLQSEVLLGGYVERELAAKVKSAARKGNRSVSEWLREVVTAALAGEPLKPAPSKVKRGKTTVEVVGVGVVLNALGIDAQSRAVDVGAITGTATLAKDSNA